MNNKIGCPYCAYKFPDEYCHYELNTNNTYDTTCYNCGRELVIKLKYEPTWTASKIEWHDCAECGINYRQDEVWQPRPNKYLDVNTHVCDNCLHILLMDDYDAEIKQQEEFLKQIIVTKL